MYDFEVITETTQHLNKNEPQLKNQVEIAKVNTIESNVKLYQVKRAILNCTKVGLNVSQNLILHREKVPKSDIHATQI